MTKVPEHIPENGFYYHYKHDPSGEINNYAYEIIGVGHHTENETEFFVIYRPLYESTVYQMGKFYDVRPVNMFMEEVQKDGHHFPRFIKITDQETISKLEEIKNKMY